MAQPDEADMAALRTIRLHRISFRSCSIACLLLCVFVGLSSGGTESVLAADRPNVLFIAIDDLRPALGCYGDPVAITPNVDRLAARGMVFERAYCQEAVCNPSRASILTGRRPDAIEVWDLSAHFRDAAPDVVTLPQYFKQNGYVTQSVGKVLHGSGRPAYDPPSWSLPPQYDYVRDPELRYSTEWNLSGEGLKRDATEAADAPDNSYVDGVVCDRSVEALETLAGGDRPFFLAVGFRKPHLPFCAPRKYWDLYDRAAIPPPAFGEHPVDAPELAFRSWQELEGYRDISSDGRPPAAKVAQLRHGYYACISYIDAQIGRLLDTLDRLELADDTVICLWGDHGFQLGEQGMWTKSNNFELATRVPLIVAVPGRANAGGNCRSLVELIDVYPTLVECCGLDVSPALDGTSLVPLLDDPGRRWKSAAFSQFPRARSEPRHKGHGEIMGYAIRTAHHRYVEWRDLASGAIVARELYDYEADPNETRNLAVLEGYRPTLEELSTELANAWPLPTR